MKQSINTDTASKPSHDVQGTILVIDDTPENLTVLRKCLTDHHYRVAVARNGKVALERAKRIRPDLILLDILMPGIDGFEVCRQLKEDKMTRAIPVIFMTALDTSEDKLKGFEAGAEDYVTKPLNNQEVLARVHTHVTLYTLQQERRTRNASYSPHQNENGGYRDRLLDFQAGSLLLGGQKRLLYPRLFIKPEDRIAVTGRNGAGKSTLLRKLITSLNVPQEHITYVPQEIGLEHSQDILTQVRALPDKQKGYMMTIVSGSGERHPCHQEETTTVWRK